VAGLVRLGWLFAVVVGVDQRGRWFVFEQHRHLGALDLLDLGLAEESTRRHADHVNGHMRILEGLARALVDLHRSLSRYQIREPTRERDGVLTAGLLKETDQTFTATKLRSRSEKRLPNIERQLILFAFAPTAIALMPGNEPPIGTPTWILMGHHILHEFVVGVYAAPGRCTTNTCTWTVITP
jgi:hypothetical protein